MEETLDKALNKIFGGQLSEPQPGSDIPRAAIGATTSEMAKLACQYYDQAN